MPECYWRALEPDDEVSEQQASPTRGAVIV